MIGKLVSYRQRADVDDNVGHALQTLPAEDVDDVASANDRTVRPEYIDRFDLPIGQRSEKCRRVRSGPIHLLPRRIRPLFLDEQSVNDRGGGAEPSGNGTRPGIEAGTRHKKDIPVRLHEVVGEKPVHFAVAVGDAGIPAAFAAHLKPRQAIAPDRRRAVRGSRHA